MSKFQRSPRKRTTQNMPVTDTITGQIVGQVGNLSADGMLLVGPRQLRVNALYQFAFTLPQARGKSQPIEIGVHAQWGEEASQSGQYWTGFHIIDIGDAESAGLKFWVNSADSA